MKICIVSPSYPTTSTHEFVFVDQLCRAIANEGHYVSIIAPQSITKSIVRRVPLVKKHTVLTVEHGIDMILLRPWFISFGNRKYLKRLSNILFNGAVRRAFGQLKNDPQICYGHFWESAFSIYPMAKKYGFPLIVSSGEEEITINKNYSMDTLKEFLGYISGIISVSTKNRSDIVRLGLAEEHSCRIIPNAVDHTLFYKKDKYKLRNELGFNQNHFIIAFVGQFNERKGVNRLSSALDLLGDESIKALFIGDGVDYPEYAGAVFCGTVDHNVLPDYLNCADLFVLPTSNEGCSNAIIEAMACGLPIISSDLSFNYDILNHENSIMINPYDIQAIADAIQTLKDDTRLLSSLSAAAYDTSLNLRISERATRVIEYIENQIK